jgi:hypothetical protein
MSYQHNPSAEKMDAWRQSPRLFAWDEFGFIPDLWQGEFLDTLPEWGAKRISLQACAGPGKTAVLAIAALWFITCLGEPGMHPKGFILSVTRDNLRDNLWPEISKWQQKGKWVKEFFTWTKERFYCNEHPQTWFLGARSFDKKASAEQQGETLSGLHSEFVLVEIDESGTIPLAVLKKGEQAMGNCKWGRIIQAGNPSSLDGMLYAAATSLSKYWQIIRISGDPLDPKRSPRIDIKWAQEQIDLYGRDDPWVMSYILGKFPPSSLNSLIGPDEVRDAMERFLRPEAYNRIQKRIGVDVARFGDDRTVLFPRQGLWSGMPTIMRGADTLQIAARVVRGKFKFESEVEFVDATGGWGGGVIDNLKAAGHSPMGINFSSRATDPRYFNKRSEMWFMMAEWVKKGGRLPKVPGLVKELSEPQYFFHKGMLRLEEKEQIKKRLGSSPDLADALALTFAMDDCPMNLAHMMPGGNTGLYAQKYQNRNVRSDWDYEKTLNND